MSDKPSATSGSARTLYGQRGDVVAAIYRRAAVLMENDPKADDTDLAISIASSERWRGDDHRAYVNRMLPRMAFRDMFGCWMNNDEGILMMGFAACAAETGDMT